MKITLSTSNPNKVEEISKIVDINIGIEWIIGKVDVEEDGTTFEENAIKKARAAYELYGPSVADDSGLEIYALDRFPGIRSARFMEGVDYTIKNRKILEMMKEFDENQRKARFVCVAVYYDGKPFTFEGVIEGKISNEIRGYNGFGYDPIFIPYGYDRTFGELSREEKNSISHRARAFKKLSEFTFSNSCDYIIHSIFEVSP